MNHLQVSAFNFYNVKVVLVTDNSFTTCNKFLQIEKNQYLKNRTSVTLSIINYPVNMDAR